MLQGASTAELKAEMIRSGMSTLRMAGISKILEGVTTPEEDPAHHGGRLTPRSERQLNLHTCTSCSRR